MYPGLQTRNPDKENNFLSENGVPDSLMARIDAAAADTAGTHIRTGYAQGSLTLPDVGGGYATGRSQNIIATGRSHFKYFFCLTKKI